MTQSNETAEVVAACHCGKVRITLAAAPKTITFQRKAK